MTQALMTVTLNWQPADAKAAHEFVAVADGGDVFKAFRHRTDFGWSWFTFTRNDQATSIGSGRTTELPRSFEEWRDVPAAPKTVCSCGCGTVVMIGDQAQGDITDGFVFEADGTLDFIELFVAGHDTARGAFRMTGRGVGDFTVFAVDRFDAFAVARATKPGVADIGILGGPGLCPGCCGDGIKSAVPNVLTCRSCGGVFTVEPITFDAALGMVAMNQAMLAKAGPDGQFLFDFVVFDVILADGKTVNRLHGWADKATKRVVQWG